MAAGGLDFIAGERNVTDFQRASRHSARVRFLRIAFPLLAVFILSIIFGAYLWANTSLPEVSIASTRISDGKMIMNNPEVNGVDSAQRPYNLTAKEARQDPKLPAQIELLEINAHVPMDEGLFARILAGTGFYDSDAKTLQLGGEVDVKTDNGMTIRMQDADVDMNAGLLKTANPVSMTTEQAQISSDRLTVENNGKKIVFENRVKMTIYPDKIDQAAKQ
jgi:lipopolysaccharide export system protein LptC